MATTASTTRSTRGFLYVHPCPRRRQPAVEFTSDGLIRTAANNCIEYFDDKDEIAVVPCDANRRQRWFIGSGLLRPMAFDGSMRTDHVPSPPWTSVAVRAPHHQARAL
ncbi:hypothetical protein PINS_up024445 [Pythium insidiosum]|nr:hypothetical protein PINS_up024445 [Pythium insidiosum]